MHYREWHASEERLACQPDHDVGVLAERPQQRDLVESRKSLAENEHALRFEFVETVHRRHSASEPGASRNFRPLVALDTRIWQHRRDVGSTAKASSSRSISSSLGGWSRSTHASST